MRLPRQGTIAPRPDTAKRDNCQRDEERGSLSCSTGSRIIAPIGIDHHLIYTNDCADGTDALLDALAEAGVTRRDNPFREMGKVPQHAAFRAAESEPVVEQADWLLTLDVDEYINIHAGQGRYCRSIGGGARRRTSFPCRGGSSGMSTVHAL